MIFHIYGKPVPKRTREWETNVRQQIKEVMDKYKMYTMIPRPKAVYVGIVFNYTKSIRGDLDNLGKCILDSMNQLVFEDASQISILHISKRKSTKDEVVVMVWIPILNEDGKLQ
jgi:Holliday junction resolvase RusA-like endonuclease